MIAPNLIRLTISWCQVHRVHQRSRKTRLLYDKPKIDIQSTLTRRGQDVLNIFVTQSNGQLKLNLYQKEIAMTKRSKTCNLAQSGCAFLMLLEWATYRITFSTTVFHWYQCFLLTTGGPMTTTYTHTCGPTLFFGPSLGLCAVTPLSVLRGMPRKKIRFTRYVIEWYTTIAIFCLVKCKVHCSRIQVRSPVRPSDELQIRKFFV